MGLSVPTNGDDPDSLMGPPIHRKVSLVWWLVLRCISSSWCPNCMSVILTYLPYFFPKCMLSNQIIKKRLQKPLKLLLHFSMLCLLMCPIHRFPWIFTMMMMNPRTLIFCVLLPKSSESLIRLVESFGSPATTTFIPVYSSSLLYSNPSKAIPAGDFFFQTPTTTSLARRDLSLAINGIWVPAWLILIF